MLPTAVRSVNCQSAFYPVLCGCLISGSEFVSFAFRNPTPFDSVVIHRTQISLSLFLSLSVCLSVCVSVCMRVTDDVVSYTVGGLSVTSLWRHLGGVGRWQRQRRMWHVATRPTVDTCRATIYYSRYRTPWLSHPPPLALHWWFNFYPASVSYN